VASFSEQVASYLRSDPELSPYGVTVPEPPLLGDYDAINDIYEGIAKGGIYTRPLKMPDPTDNRGSTPTAFNPGSGVIRPSIVVRTESIVHHPQFIRMPQAIMVNIMIWMYGPSHDNGKIALEDMRTRVDLLMIDRDFQTDQGPRAFVSWDFNFGVKENHQEFEGSLVDYTRYNMTTLLHLEA
jgi:hypothetical protein